MFYRNKTKNSTTNIAICLAILSPILSMYGAGGVSLAIIIILFSFSILIANGLFSPIKSIHCVILSLYIIIQVFLYDYSSNILFRTIQYLFLLTIPFMINYRNLDIEKGLVFYRYISVVASLFIIVQYFSLNFLHIYISGVFNIPLFPPSESLSEILGGTIYTGRRVSGFFSEPASHSVYILGIYAITLFDNELKNRYKYISIFSVGLLCSVSSTGILTMIGLLFIKFLTNVKSSLKWLITPQHLIVTVLIFIGIEYTLSTGIQDLFVYRIEEGNSAASRFAGYKLLQNQSLLYLILGHGMDLEALEDSFFSGIPRYIYYFGLWGLILWLFMLYHVTREIEPRFKYLGLTYLILNTGESCMLGFSGFIFMIFLCNAKYGKSNITNRFLLSK